MTGHPDHPPRPLRRLWELISPDRSDIWLVFLFASGVGILSLATPIAIEALVNTVANVGLREPVIILALIMFGCLALAAAMTAMQAFVVECIQRRIFVRVAADFAHRLPRVRLEAYDRHHGPELINRFFDVLNVQKGVATLLLDGLSIVTTTIVGLTVLALYHATLLTFGVVLVAGLCFMLFVLGRGGIRSGLRESHAKYDIAGWLEEITRVPRAFKTSGGPRLAEDHAGELLNEYVRARRSHYSVVFRQFVFALGLQVVASSMLLGVGGFLVIGGGLTLGQLVAAELIVSLIVGSFTKMSKYIESYYDICVGVEKLGVITDLDIESDDGDHVAVHERGIGLSAAGWEVKPDERVALVGPSGVGKSVMLDTLAGLREPEAGRVVIDGVDLRQLRLADYRRQVAIVGGVEIVTGTIAENLHLGKPDATAAEMRAVLDRVGLLGVVSSMPAGFETPTVPSGSPLSSGQAMRLCLARAMLASPRLLIIDGVLDLLDFAPCPDLLDSLFAPDAPWTLVVATHRDEVIARCGRVVRLENAP